MSSETMPDRLRSLGAQVRAHRRGNSSMTRAELAQLAGVSPSTIGRIERGQSTDVATLWRVADALGVSLVALVLWSEAESSSPLLFTTENLVSDHTGNIVAYARATSTCTAVPGLLRRGES